MCIPKPRALELWAVVASECVSISVLSLWGVLIPHRLTPGWLLVPVRLVCQLPVWCGVLSFRGVVRSCLAPVSYSGCLCHLGMSRSYPWGVEREVFALHSSVCPLSSLSPPPSLLLTVLQCSLFLFLFPSLSPPHLYSFIIIRMCYLCNWKPC